MKTYGKVKIKKINPSLDDIPKDCGYMKRFRFNIETKILITVLYI